MKKNRVAVAMAAALLALGVAAPPVRVTLGRGLALLATGQLAQFQQYLQSLGPWAPLVSVALMVSEALAIPVPVTVIMLANGLVFGVWGGGLVSIAGGLAGALAAYAIGRWIGRALLDWIVPASSLQWADRLMAMYGRWAIVIERWIPGIPGDPVSYAAGMTRVPVASFLGLTIVGIVPAAVASAWLGSQIAGDVPLAYWLSGLLLALVLWVAWRGARRRQPAR